MIFPRSFAIHVTYTCPLACAHCCFSSSPANKDRLDIEHILSTLDALDAETIKMVAFTGGEPLLLGDQLMRAIRRAKDRGLTTRVVTSAYFGRQPKHAARIVDQLTAAGLDELSISWDDFHEEFVPFDAVINTFKAARAAGMTVAINTVQAADSKWSRARLLDELGEPEDSDAILSESPLNKTGRARTELEDAQLRPERTVGPCPYVLTGPTLSARNKLLACCGVIQETPELVLDPDFHPANLEEAIQRGMDDPLLNWIYLRGPYAVLAYIGTEFGAAVPAREDVGGNCEACHILFHTPEIRALIPAALERQQDAIMGELRLLDALGLAGPTEIMSMWAEESRVHPAALEAAE